ncbi:hypothetical protein [Pedobacter sp. SG918]|nr:hypothetical protein [Pedobacter sp. SG918]
MSRAQSRMVNVCMVPPVGLPLPGGQLPPGLSPFIQIVQGVPAVELE